VGTVPGTYVLVLCLSHDEYLRVAHLGTHTFKAGYYCYVGSARGPGGLRARLSRHLRQRKKPHWHIDYLLPRATVVEVWAAPSTERLECLCAQTLLSMSGAEVLVPSFGSSDCGCETHLLYFAARPSIHDFRGRLRSSTPGVPLFTTILQQ
jgi:Uri superfamily endonuclease